MVDWSSMGFFSVHERNGHQVLVHAFAADSCRLPESMANQECMVVNNQSFLKAALKSNLITVHRQISARRRGHRQYPRLLVHGPRHASRLGRRRSEASSILEPLSASL